MIRIKEPGDLAVCRHIVGRCLLSPADPVAPLTVPIAMHHWLTAHGLAPGLVIGDDGTKTPGWTVWDIDAARAAVGAMAWPRGREAAMRQAMQPVVKAWLEGKLP